MAAISLCPGADDVSGLLVSDISSIICLVYEPPREYICLPTNLIHRSKSVHFSWTKKMIYSLIRT